MLISWNTTNRCNLYCDHCYRDAGASMKDELSTAEARRLVEEAAALGFKIFIFSGGEPLLREDLVDIIPLARQKGLLPVIGSNGTLLDRYLAQELKDCGTANIGISLDSVAPDEHDNLRNTPGSWEGAVAGMRYCREVGLKFQVHTTIMDFNSGQVEELTDLAVKLGAAAHHIFFLVPTGRGAEIEDKSLQAGQYEDILQRILKKQQQVEIELKPSCAPQFMRLAKQMGLNLRFERGCLAGIAYCLVSPRGVVQPCAYLNIAAGNIRDASLKDIWEQAEPFVKLRSEKYSGNCGFCYYRKICGGCRARAYYYHGDYMASEPWCSYQAGGKIG